MKPTTERDYRERMLRVLVHIQEHIDEDLPLEDLARLAYFSPFHFHRIFRGMVGEPLREHVRRLRLERAAQRLRYGCESVTRIALDAGFEAHEAFTRAFRRAFGCSPSAYRRRARPPRAAAPAHVHWGTPQRFQPVKTGGESMDIRVEMLPQTRVAFVRHRGPNQDVGEAWGKLMAWAWPRGLVGPATRMIGLCHDDPAVTPPEKIRYDACLTAGPDFQPDGEVGVQEIAGGEYAVTTHRGPYDGLHSLYARLCGEWLPASGRELRAVPPFEVYRNSPQDTAPEDLLTDIYLPLTEAR